MANEGVGTLMEKLIREVEAWDNRKLACGDAVEITKLLNDCGIIKTWSASEIYAEDEDTRAEAVYLLNQLRKESLKVTPCLRGLLAESAAGKCSPRHDEMLKCACGFSDKLRELLSVACVEFAPDAWELYQLKFN